MLMPLKLKYQQPGRTLHRQFDPPQGTLVYTAGRHGSKKGGNSGSGKVKPKAIKPPRRAYGPW